jgi:hypothetical protein
MRKLLPFFAFLMLVLSSLSGLAHAAETVSCSDVLQSEASLHSYGDRDQVPSDAEKGYPHHHGGCHGHHIGTPVADRMVPQRQIEIGQFALFQSDVLSPHHDGPALRPPQA